MNSLLKWTLIVLNIIMLFLAFRWYNEKNEKEPLIAIYGQIASLLGLIFEKQFSRIIARKITNSRVKLDVKSGDKIKTEKIKDSDIDIKTN